MLPQIDMHTKSMLVSSYMMKKKEFCTRKSKVVMELVSTISEYLSMSNQCIKLLTIEILCTSHLRKFSPHSRKIS